MPGDKSAIRSRADITVPFNQVDENGIRQLMNAPRPLFSDRSPTNYPISRLVNR
jgi:hypothetical protein